MNSTKKPLLKLDWCTYEAAKHAVLHWHYSKAMPSGKLVKIGVWENGEFKGAIIFGLGANAHISKMFPPFIGCELVRIALRKHDHEVTRMVSIAIKMLKKLCPELAFVVSYADRDQGHEGAIYKAGNWLKHGVIKDQCMELFGQKVHPRTVVAKYGSRSLAFIRSRVDPNASYLATEGKIRYVYFLNSILRQKHLR